MTSFAELFGTLGSAGYRAVAPGIINLAKTAVKEFGPYNSTVNAVTAGLVGMPINFKVKDKECNALSMNRRSILI